MILLTSSDSLQVVLAGAPATTQPVLYASYADLGADTFTPGTSNGTTNGTTAATWVVAPAASTTRQVKYLSLYNADTGTVTVTARINTTRTLVKVALAAGERLEYTDGNGFRVLSATGAEKGASSGSGGSETVTVSTVTAASGTLTLDFAGASKAIFKTTLGANVTTLAFANLPGSGYYAEYELHIAQDGTGSWTFALPSSHKALGGSDTAIASAAGSTTVLTASTVDGGAMWRYAMQESA